MTETTPRVGAMRVVREDQHNWVTERFSEITNKKTGETREEWKTVGYFGNLDQDCTKALQDGAGGSDAQTIIDELRRSLKEIKQWSRLASVGEGE